MEPSKVWRSALVMVGRHKVSQILSVSTGWERDGEVGQVNQHQHEVNIQSSKTNVSSLGNAYIPSDNVIVSKAKISLLTPDSRDV